MAVAALLALLLLRPAGNAGKPTATQPSVSSQAGAMLFSLLHSEEYDSECKTVRQ